MMSSASFLKSKAFKEREEKEREKIRQAAKENLIADLSRLFGDTTFSDISLIVNNVEFQAHTVVLRARAPNFCQHFLPRYASPVSVKTCIQINGLEATEFEKFLRSAYTEDDFTDYYESSYPWKKQDISNSVDKIDQVVNIELKEDSASFWNDTDRIHDQPQNNIQPVDCVVKASVIATPVQPEEFDQDDITCTQSHCDMDSENSGIVADSIVMESVEAGDPSRNNNNNYNESYTKSQRASCMEDTLNNDKELAHQESCHPLAIEVSNKQQPGASDVDQQQQHSLHTDLVDGLSGMVVQERAESDCPEDGCDSHTPHSSCLFSGKADEVEITNGITYELTTTDDRIFDNNFKTKQDPYLTGNHTLPNEPLESELKSCCCNLGQDLLQLLMTGAGSDVVFVVNGDKVKAHKAILCARSNYFSAMLYGDWIEGKTNEIPLIGVNYNGFMTILKYIYGGTAHVKSDVGIICDTLPLVDMYGLEGLREIITCTLKIDKCHMFHKPCTECLTGVPECLEVSELFGLTELKKSCIKWMARHFDRVLGTKGFATLPKQLQEEILAEIQRSFVIASAIEVLNHCDKLSSCTPLVKWTEPVHMAISAVQGSCLLFVTENFFSLIDERSFHEILKGVGWSVPVLEKILSAVKKNLTVENCCDQLRAILKLQRILKMKAQEEDEECYLEEVGDLVINLHNDCVKFIRSNLFKVTRSEGWKRLKVVTQREVKEGAVCSGLTDSGERFKGKRSLPSSLQTSTRPSAMSSTRSSFQRAATESRARGLGRGNPACDRSSDRSSQHMRPPSGRSSQTRTGPAPTNNRPSSGRPSSAGNSIKSVRGKISSATSNNSEKRPLSSRASMPLGSSRNSSSLSRDSDKTSSARGSSASGHGKMLSNTSSAQNSLQQTVTSNNRGSSMSNQNTSHVRLSSAPSSSGAIKKVPSVSRPPLPKGNGKDGNSNSFKRIMRDKPLSVGGCGTQPKKGPTVSNSRPSHHQVAKNSMAPTPSCKTNKSSTSVKETTSRKELVQGITNGLGASTEPKLGKCVSRSREDIQSCKNETSGTRKMEETLDITRDNNKLQEELKDGAQANGPGDEEQSVVSTAAENTEECSLLLNEAVGENVSKSPCDDSLENSKINDSLELD